jgi:soluble lytic murein transglycosylase
MNQRSQSLSPKTRRKLTALTLSLTTIAGCGIIWWTQQDRSTSHLGADAGSEFTHLPNRERTSTLESIVKTGGRSIAVNRAKYILASDALDRYQAKSALDRLTGLEKDYPILAPQIVWKRAQAYQQLDRKSLYLQTLQSLVTDYPQSPVVVEALFILGQQDSKYWNMAIEKFPSHPRSLELIQKQLAQTPNRPDLLLLSLKYLDDSSNRRLKVADRLVMEYPTELRPEDWDLIGNIYWQNHAYRKVANPLKKGSKTPQNAYTIARSYAIEGQKTAAKIAYQETIDKYPNSEEADKSTIGLADLSNKVEAIAYLDRAIARSSTQTALALAKKATIVAAAGDLAQAKLLREELVSKYPHSEAVADYRWQLAQQAGRDGNFETAWSIAKQIVTDTPNSKYTVRAAFWIGKWARKSGKLDAAKQAFEYTIEHYPRSYYSWRAAHYLGWDTGDFDRLIERQPTLTDLPIKTTLPIGSDALKELFAIGQDREAWELWQTEFQHRDRPELLDIFTQGLLYRSADRNINCIVELNKIEDEERVSQATTKKLITNRADYWQNLYPLVFLDEIKSSGKSLQVNPVLIISVIRQESKFSPVIKSPVGALGLMQVIPDTASFAAKKMNMATYDLTDPADNIRLGSWYLKYTHSLQRHNTMLAIASYNAGPGNVDKWIKEYGTQDLDDFVERIPFEETQNYVKTVLGNYWNYLILYNPEVRAKMSPLLK